MNKHLQQRIEALLALYDRATLATCGQAGIQISVVAFHVQNLRLYLFIPHSSDHLFNLESEQALALLSPAWKLYGKGVITKDIIAPHEWQITTRVEPTRLHILSNDGLSTVETIDF
ncbi:MAG: hypothetical protein RLP44_05640 [Aggregatilineales bacterium]